jgi:hypothetical protein
MNRYKRTLMAAAMLVLISMPIGLFIFYKIQQIIVKHEMMEKLEHSELQTIDIPAAEVRWYEENREIVVGGKLFDVFSQTKIAGTDIIRFSGLFDEAETELEHKTGRLLQEKEKNDDTHKLLVQAVWLFNSPLQSSASLSTLYTESSKAYNPFIATGVPLADISVPAPPPKA